MNTVRGLHVIGTTLFVADGLNNRILGFSTASLSSGMNATFKLDLTNPSCSTNSLNQPEQVFSDGTKLYIPDRDRNRVAVFNSIPSAAACPNYILGQTTLTAFVSGTNTESVGGGAFDASGNLYLMNRGNRRVDKFAAAEIPTATGLFPTPATVWGAFDNTSNGPLSSDQQALGGFGYWDSYAPAIVGNLMIIGDRLGRISIVPKP